MQELNRNGVEEFDDEQSKEPIEFNPPAFPIDALPSNLVPIVRHYAQLNNTPLELNATAALTMAAACCGKRLRIATTEGKLTQANLFAIIFAPSGMGKSVTLRRWTEPIIEHERRARDQFEEIVSAREARILVLESETKSLIWRIKKCEDEIEKDRLETELRRVRDDIRLNKDRLIPPQFIASNCTSESLALVMAENDETSLSFTAEGKEVLSNILGRYHDHRDTDETLYLKGFSGDLYRSDRITRRQVTLDQPVLCCLWGAQLDILQRLLRNRRLTEGGLLPRFLLCVYAGQIPYPSGAAIDSAFLNAWHTICFSLLRTYRSATSFFEVPRPPATEQIMADFQRAVIDRMNNGLVDIQSYAARWSEIAWRMALVCHAIANGSQAHTTALLPQTASDAIDVIKYYAAVQTGLLVAQTEDNQFRQLKRLKQILVERYNGATLARNVCRNNGFKIQELEILAVKFPQHIALSDIPASAGARAHRMIEARFDG